MRTLKQLAQLAVVALVAFAGSLATKAVDGHGLATLAVGLATAVAALLAYAGVVRRTEHRRALEVARQGSGRTLAVGAGVGVGMFAAVVGVIALFGGYHVDGWGSVSGALGMVGVVGAAAAVTEELMFRGVVLRALEERVGTWVALAVTSALFGGAHLINPDATLVGGLAIAVEAGAMLGAAYVATRSL